MGALEQLDAVVQSVQLAIYDPLDARLNDQFGAFQTG